MKISARNVFAGKISAIRNGVVNAQVELVTEGGDRIVAIVTEGSVESLGLAEGKEALAFVKAPWVMVLAGEQNVRFSARNQFAGIVNAVSKGAVNATVGIALPSGAVIQAVVTNEAVMDLGLKEGVPATALIKASHVVLGVPT
jgi:molybdate transport system regulatory protein